MSAQDMHIDPELLAEFIDESLEMLSGLSPLFVEMEEKPDDGEVIQSIFRPIHSIKGNSHFFGFFHVKELAHEMETVLDLFRKGLLPVSGAAVDALLRGADQLTGMLNRGRDGLAEVEDEAAFNALVEEVKAQASAVETPPAVLAQRVIEKLTKAQGAVDDPASDLSRFLEEALADLRTLAPEEEKASAGAGAASAPGGLAGELLALLSPPNTFPFNEDQIEQAHALLLALKKERNEDTGAAAVAEMLDSYDTFVGSVGFDDLLGDILKEKLAELPELPEAAAPAPEENAGAAPAAGQPAAQKAAPAKSHGERTMRVAEDQIDAFLENAGELLVVGDMFEHLETQLYGMRGVGREITTTFKQANETFAALSEQLQNSILSIRRVSVKGLLQKLPRIVRDVAANKGKDIKLVTEGEEVQVDKSLLDLLDAPLVHMVRNAADHGVETPETREAAGKPRQGIVTLRVEELDEVIQLTVADDGAGLNLKAIQKKAESLGLIGPGQTITERDIIDLMFSSGVSTAAEVSDVSGRGVGMDVVKTQLDEAGGKIEVTTEAGRGTTFTLSLPKGITTQIIQGFRVEVAGQCFVLPTDRIHETVAVGKDALHSVPDKGLFVKLHGDLFPVSVLREELCLGAANHGNDRLLLVNCTSRGRRIAVAVDEVLGMQKVVLRQIEGLPTNSDIIAGGALMGDGSVALVINMDELAR